MRTWRLGLILVTVTGCSKPGPATVDGLPAVAERDRKGKVVLLHTNDIHANLRPSVVPGSDGPPVGGARAIGGWVEAVQGAWGPDRVLVLDAGDLLSGTPLDEYEVGGVRGGAMLGLLEALEVDAWAVGNHEFDRGMDDARAFLDASPVPALSANLDDAQGGRAIASVAGSVVLQAADLRVGVIGLTTPGLTRYVNEDLAGLVVSDPSAAARAEIDALGDVDVLVALTHLGLEGDRALAADVPELDVIVGGHSHTRLQAAEQVGSTWIVQAGCCMRGIGRTVVTPAGDGTVAVDYTLIEPDPDALPAVPSAEMRSWASEWEGVLARDWGVAVGTNDVGALGRQAPEESPLGRWVGETLRLATGADVGLYNRSGLRADLPAGTLRREDLYAVFPFGNEVVVVTMTGQELAALAVKNATALADPDGGRILEQDGLGYTWRTRMGAAEIVALTLDGVPVDPDATYTLATNDFVVRQWSRYVGGTPRDPRRTGETVRDVVETRIRAEGISAVPPVRAVRWVPPR